MTDKMKIGEKTFVSLIYTLNVDGRIVDSATKENPLGFPFGAGYLLPKFEEHINGLGVGDKFEFTLSPADGYGEEIEQAIVELPVSVFMVEGKVEEGLLTIGNQIPMSTADGQHMIGVVRAVTLDNVTMDFNHPMAGKTLNFSGEIVEVREATDEDFFHGMEAGGCDCGDCEGGDKSGGCSCGCR
jgi:FKBP-type peptidyl-prolyl cis-trans isomerase SlyD